MKSLIAFICLCVLCVFLLVPFTATASKIATQGDLTAHLDEKFVCAERVTVRVEAPGPEPFTDPDRRMELERLFAATRAGLGFECQTVETIYLKGYVENEEVYRGIASAGAEWVLLDVPFATGKLAAAKLQKPPLASKPVVLQTTPAGSRKFYAEERVRLFGKKGERAFTPLLVQAFGYRAQLLDFCKPGEGKQFVPLEMKAFYAQHLPEAFEAAEKAFDSYINEKEHNIPPCNTGEYNTLVKSNEMELNTEKTNFLDLINTLPAKIIKSKQHLQELGFYKGPINDTPDDQFWNAFRRWAKYYLVDPVGDDEVAAFIHNPFDLVLQYAQDRGPANDAMTSALQKLKPSNK